MDITELKRLYANSTQGKWSHIKAQREVHGHSSMLMFQAEDVGGMLGHSPKESESDCGATLFKEDDAKFITAVHNCLPELLDLLDKP